MTSLLAFAFVAFGLGQSPSTDALNRSIDFQSHSAMLPVLVGRLAEQTGVPLIASPSLSNEIVLVNVKQTRIWDLMQRIADATASEWVQAGEKFALRRSNTKLAAEAKLEQAEKIRKFQAAIDRATKTPLVELTMEQALESARRINDLQKQMQDNAENDPGFWERYAAAQKSRPSERLASRLVRAVTAQQLASMAEGDRIVFSLTPTPMQQPLNAAASRAVAQYLEESELWKEAAQRLGSEPEELGDLGSSNKPTRVLMTVGNSGFGPMTAIALNILLYDKDGSLAGNGSTSLSTIDEDQMKGLEAELESDKQKKQKPIAYRDESKEYATGFRFYMPSKTDKVKISDDLRRKYADPVKFEPLSFGASDIVHQLAEPEKLNLVAVMPDLFAWLGFTESADMNPALVLRMFVSMDLVRIRKQDGWMVLTPTDQESERRNRTDRVLASRMLQQILVTGKASLDARADFVAATETMGFENLAGQLQSALMGEQNPDLLAMMMGADQPLRFWGRLGKSQRDRLLRGESLPLGTLTPYQFRPLHQMVFGVRGGVQYRPPQEGGRQPEALVMADEDTEYEGYEGNTPGYWMAEPTNAFPNGLPRNGLVKVAVRSKTMLMTYHGESTYGFVTPIESLGSELFYRSRPQEFPWASESEFTSRRYKPVLTSDLIITVALGPNHTLRRKIRDTSPLQPGVQPVPFEQLPKDIRDQALAAAKKAEEQHKNIPTEVEQGEATPPTALPPVSR